MSELLIDTSQAQRGDKSHAMLQTIVEGTLTVVPLCRGLSGKIHTRETMGNQEDKLSQLWMLHAVLYTTGVY